ncbi:MAG: signal recognition particle-docking protein FtsY [archaeon]|nr:signal recognition particle-docking protein FtsY [archaeon]
MFKFLKEKIENWTKKIAKAEEKEEAIAEKPKQIKKEKEIEKKEKITEKPVKIEPKPVQKGPEKKEEDFEPGKGFFAKIREKIKQDNIKISEEDFQNYSMELEMILLENNVALEITDKVIKELKEQIVNKEIPKKEVELKIKESFKEILSRTLIEPINLIEKINERNMENPYVIIFCGINGSGKTTTIAKIGNYLKKNNISCIFAAADTFRAASIEQLKKHGNRLGIEVISHDYGTDPASVGFDAIKYAKKHYIDCVLIDTAGRMHTAKDLLREMEKIVKVTNPNLKIFVGESITGNDSIEQIKGFNDSIRLDGIILSKADIDEKGGTALSLGYMTKKPILFLGTGQDYEDLEPFNKDKFIERLGL